MSQAQHAAIQRCEMLVRKIRRWYEMTSILVLLLLLLLEKERKVLSVKIAIIG